MPLKDVGYIRLIWGSAMHGEMKGPRRWCVISWVCGSMRDYEALYSWLPGKYHIGDLVQDHGILPSVSAMEILQSCIKSLAHSPEAMLNIIYSRFIFVIRIMVTKMICQMKVSYAAWYCTMNAYQFTFKVWLEHRYVYYYYFYLNILAV